MSVAHGIQKPKAPAAVGWAREWWGQGDPALNAMCEAACAPLEAKVRSILGNTEQLWPFADHQRRVLLAQFIALHVIRTDAMRDWFGEAREDSLRRLGSEWDANVPFHRFAEHMRSDRERARKLLTLNKLASVIASMHWTLLCFEEPILITSDHPVCPVPFTEGDEPSQVSAMPKGGWAHIMEFRFPLTPKLALIGSWQPGDDEKIVDGDLEDAVNINAILRAQARRWWFQVHPGPLPAFPSAILREPQTAFEAITLRRMPGYDAAVARSSRRRLGVVAEVEKLIESQEDKLMFVARPQLVPRAA